MPRPAHLLGSMPRKERHGAGCSSEWHQCEDFRKPWHSVNHSGVRNWSCCGGTLSPDNNCKHWAPRLLRRPDKSFIYATGISWGQLIYVVSLFMVLASSVPAVGGPDAEYCRTSSITGFECQFCNSQRQTLPDGCRDTVDAWHTSVSWCIRPSQINRCGEAYTYTLVANNNRSAVGGELNIFQDRENRLIITFKLYCPYTIRPGVTYVDDVDERYALGLYLWNTTRLKHYQYSDGVAQFTGVFSCLTAVINLNKVCDPNCSEYGNDPLAVTNNMCSKSPAVDACPPVNISTHRNLVIQPYVNAFISRGSQCKVSNTSTLFVLDGAEPGGFVKWDALACGPVGTLLRSPSPQPPQPRPPPQLPVTRSAPLNYPQWPWPPSPDPRTDLGEPNFPPNRQLSPPRQPPPSLPPPKPPGSLRPPPPSSLKPTPPSPKPPSPQPPKPRPPPPSPTPQLPVPPSLRQPPIRLPPPRVTLENPPPQSPSPNVDRNSGMPSSVEGEQQQPLASHLPHYPPSPAPPTHTNAAKSFFSSAGVGVLAGCGAVALALFCCCGVTAYVFCRRSSREQISVGGEPQPSLSCNSHGPGNDGDDGSLSNFSFRMRPQPYDKERSPSSCGAASFSAGMTVGDMERGSNGRTCGSNLELQDCSTASMSGESYLSVRPPSFQSDLPSSSPPSQVYVKLDHSGKRAGAAALPASDLLNMHAAQAAAMRIQAECIAAAGGAASRGAAAAVVSWPGPAPSSPFPAAIAPSATAVAVSTPPTPRMTAMASKPVPSPLPQPLTPPEPRGGGVGGGFELMKRRGRMGRGAPGTPTAVSTAKLSLAGCQAVDFVPPAAEDDEFGGPVQNSSCESSSSNLRSDEAEGAEAAIASVAALGSQMVMGGKVSTAAAAAAAAAANSSSGGSASSPPSLLTRLSSALRLGGSVSGAAVAAAPPSLTLPDSSQDRTRSLSQRSRSPSPGPSRSATQSQAGTLLEPSGSGSPTGAANSADGISHYPSIFAVPPAANPAATLAATTSCRPAARSGGGIGGSSVSNPYPPLFTEHLSVGGISPAASLSSGSVPAPVVPAQQGRRSPSPPLATIPSGSPLILPESTFATYAPANLDDDDDDDGMRPVAVAALAPYGTVTPPLAPASLRLQDQASTSLGASLVAKSSTPSSSCSNRPGVGVSVGVGSNSSSAAAAAGAGAAAAAAQSPLLPSGPGLRHAADVPKGGSGSPEKRPGAGVGRSSRGNLLTSEISLPTVTSAGAGTSTSAMANGSVAAASAPASAGGSPWLRAAAASPTGKGQVGSTFSFSSVGAGSASADGGIGLQFHRGPSATGGTVNVSGPSVASRGGSPLRHAVRVGSPPSTPSTLQHLPTSSLQPPPPLAAIAQPEGAVLHIGSTSPGKQPRSSGSIQVPIVAPPPLHLQPLDGPHGSLVRPPQPLALQQRSSLPMPNLNAFSAASGSTSPPILASRSSSPTPILPSSRSVVPGSGLSSPLSRSPSTSPLRHTSSAGLPLPTAGSVNSSAGCSPISRQHSQRLTASINNMASCPSSPHGGTGASTTATTAGGAGGLTSRILSAGSLTAFGAAGASFASSSASSWGSAVPQFMDLDSIRRFCGNGLDGDGGQLAAACGCDPNGEEVPLGGAGSDGLVAVYNAVCKLEPGALFCNKYKIRETPILGRHSVVLLAKNVYNKTRVAIKFHADRRQYEREKAALQTLSATHVPALQEPLDGPQLAALGLPPALVMEAGRCTLTDWLRGDGGGAPRDLLSLKGALHQILAALVHIHSRRLVHRDIKPSNIMWFEDAHRFKLIDLAESAAVGEAAPPCCTPLYSAPEQIKAALEGVPSPAAVAPAADMWSFGIVAFEVLSGGSRFYGPSPSLSEVLEAVFGHRSLPSEGDSALAGFELAQARRLISHLVVRSPAQRWSAATCHRNALFASGDDTDQRAAKWDSMLSRISEVHQTVAITTAEVRTAQMAINFVICEAAPSSPGGSSGFDRAMSTSSNASSGPPRLQHMDSSRISRRVAYREVPMMTDDCLPGEPIFMLLLRKQYQIRITVAHARGLKLDICNIEHLKLTTPDNQVQVLPVRLETSLRDGGVEYVAEWDPGSSRSRHLLMVTANEGPIQRRVVFLNSELVVQLSGVPQPMTVNAMLYVVIEKQSLRYSMAKLKLWSADRWSQAPQWMRDVAKGTMVLVKVAGNVVGV